jgi:predicted SprT family Zn-dependent metalloprotease
MLDGMPRRTWTSQVVAALTAVLALELAGCAPRMTPPYSDAERARLDEYEKAADRILKSREIAGRPPAVRVGSDPALVTAGHPSAYYERRTSLADVGRPGTIVVNRSALADDYIAQAVLSHELAHFVLGHTDERCRDQQHDCEVEAYVGSVELLMTGWGHSYADAVRLQYAYLKSVVLAVQRGEATVARGHVDPCRELQEFSARFQASATCD